MVSSVPALVKEPNLTSSEEPSPAEDESIFDDVDVTITSPLERKRTRRSSSDTINPSAKVPDIASEPELEEPRLAKRRRPSERQLENLILGHAPTPEPMPLSTPGRPDSRSRASNEPSPSPLGNNSQGGGAGSPVPSLNSLNKEINSNNAHARGTVEELLHSPRQSISPFKEVEGKKNRNCSDNEVGESHEDDPDQVDQVSGIPSVKTSQRSKRSDGPVPKRGRGLSQATLRRGGWSMVPTRTSRNVISPQPCQLSKPRTDSSTWSCSPRTSSPGKKAEGGPNKNYGPIANIAYQITDLTHCHVPEGSSIVTVTVRCSESICLNQMALYQKLLGSEGKVIRMTQLSPGSWMLLGYRYNDGASGPCTRGSSHATRMSIHHSHAASHETDYLDDDWDEEDENGEEGVVEYEPAAPSSDQEFSRVATHFRPRKHKPWLEASYMSHN